MSKVAAVPASPSRRRALGVLSVLAASALMARALVPTHRIAASDPVDLERLVPAAFGDWQPDPGAGAIVNSQQSEQLKALYSQTLSRGYVHARTGKRIMLVIAYGEDQRDGMRVHYPEVCYPAQGFEVKGMRTDALSMSGGDIPVRRMLAQQGSWRSEPVTYWTTVGNQAVLGGVEKKLIELRYGLRGEVPDGLLFRVSSIELNPGDAYAVHDQFVKDLLDSVPAAAVTRLSGLRGSR